VKEVPLHSGPRLAYASQVTFEQFYLGCLAHASYLIGSDGIAAVVDPQRDVDPYLETARQQGLRIAHIIETHLHADFVSGHQELAQRTGATIYIGEGSGATFPHRGVRDGDEIEFGKCRLRFLETPGHTLESISVVVIDLERGGGPAAALTGDTLFIGDVGRPDLADNHTPQELAGMLYTACPGSCWRCRTRCASIRRTGRAPCAGGTSAPTAARP